MSDYLLDRYEAFHERVGTAGLIVAVIALIAALGGTAIAAKGALTAKQKKEVTKIAQKFAGVDGKDGAPGATGAAGPQGPKGDPGAKGDTGPQGAPGAPGKAGTDGEDGFCSVNVPECALPPGASLTGNWSFQLPSGAAKPAGAFVFSNISFPLRVMKEVGGPSFIWIGQEEWLEPGEEYDTTACPGSAREPAAEPGFLCVYADHVNNAGLGNRREPSGLAGFTADRSSGLTMGFEIVAEEDQARGYGSWAVTAPE